MKRYFINYLYLQILDEIQRVYTIVNPDLTDKKIIISKANDTDSYII